MKYHFYTSTRLSTVFSCIFVLSSRLMYCVKELNMFMYIFKNIFECAFPNQMLKDTVKYTGCFYWNWHYLESSLVGCSKIQNSTELGRNCNKCGGQRIHGKNKSRNKSCRRTLNNWQLSKYLGRWIPYL